MKLKKAKIIKKKESNKTKVETQDFEKNLFNKQEPKIKTRSQILKK